MNDNKIHSLWISGPLQPINLLTIRSFQKHGHEMVIYSYDLGITDECEVRDARLIMPESEIFYYKNMVGGNPNFKFGGIAERLKAEMLYQLGGWHVDLDVTCLKSLELFGGLPYVLRPHKHGVVGNIIKAPKGCEMAKLYLEHTKTITADNRNWELSFMGLNEIVKKLSLEKYILAPEILGDDSPEYWELFLQRGYVPHPNLHAIHWCNAMQRVPEHGSFLNELFKIYNL